MPSLIITVLSLLVPAHADEPAWLSKPHLDYPFATHFAGSGSAEFRKKNGREQARKTAHDKALAALAREISVTVKEASHDFLKTTIEGEREHTVAVFDQTVEVTTEHQIRLAQIAGEQIWKRALRQDVMCVRVVLGRADTAKRLAAKLPEKRQAAADHFREAQQALARADLSAALRHLVSARTARMSDYGEEALWRIVMPDAGSARLPGPTLGAINGALETIVSGLTIERVRGDRQPLRAGGLLRDPLTVQANWANNGKKRPVAGLPVAFSFQNASGQMLAGVEVQGKGSRSEVEPRGEAFVVETDANGQTSAGSSRSHRERGPGSPR